MPTYPAGIQRWNNVEVVSALYRSCFSVISRFWINVGTNLFQRCMSTLNQRWNCVLSTFLCLQHRLSTLERRSFNVIVPLDMFYPASILYKSTAGRYRPVSYPDGPITARYRFIKNAYWVYAECADLIRMHTCLGLFRIFFSSYWRQGTIVLVFASHFFFLFVVEPLILFCFL